MSGARPAVQASGSQACFLSLIPQRLKALGPRTSNLLLELRHCLQQKRSGSWHGETPEVVMGVFSVFVVLCERTTSHPHGERLADRRPHPRAVDGVPTRGPRATTPRDGRRMRCGLPARKGVKSCFFLSLDELPCFHLLLSVCSRALMTLVGNDTAAGGSPVGLLSGHLHPGWGAAEDRPGATGGGSIGPLQAEAPWSHHLQTSSSKTKLLRLSG